MAIQTFVLENGMHVYLEENHAAPVISFNALVKVGSAFETDEEAGIAHFIEHMLFKGTPTFPVGTIAREIEAAGGEVNAYTSFDQTVYYINMASRYADRGLEILADAIANPLFDATEVDREREVILEEIRRGKDNPSHQIGEMLFENAFVRHPYRRPIIGFPQTVTSFDRARLTDFFKRWYTPKNIAFIVVGDFEMQTMFEKIKKAFASVSGDAAPIPLADALLDLPQQKPISTIAAANIQSTHFACGFHIPEITHADVPALDVLSHILGGADTSRLEQEVKEKKQLVQRVFCYAYSMRHPGLFTVGGLCEDSKLEPALTAVHEEIKKITQSPVSTTELTRAKLNIRSSEIYERESVGGQASKLAYFLATAGTHDFETRYYQMLTDVTIEDVRRVARTYLTQENCTSIFLTPEKSQWNKKNLPVVSEKKVVTAKGSKKTANGAPFVHRFKNGLTLIIRENHILPIVSMVIGQIGGTRFETKANNGISNLVANTLTKGTTTRSAIQIAHDTEKIAGSLSGFSGRNTIGLKGEFLSEHIREGFHLFADVLTHPAFASDEVAKEKKQLLHEIRNQEDALDQLAFIQFLGQLYPRHPYGLRSLGTKESLTKLTPAMLRTYWANSMRAKGAVMAISGDVSPDEIIELAKEFLSDLPSGAAKAPKIKPDSRPKKILSAEMKKKNKQQAHIVLGFQGPTFKGSDRHAMAVLNNLLSGQGGRLFLKLRDEMSLAYSVTSIVQYGIDPGYFAVYIGTDPAKIDTAIDGIKNELAKISDTVVSESELSRAQQYLVGTYELDRQRNSSIASSLAFNQLYGLGLEEIGRYPQQILAVTAQDVQKTARKYIDLDRYVLSVVRPG
ncbi:MAG: insulinase family protein [Deltaproteobacteria bacterium]|nr:insulinase family protein [Deltaproteobacteria bacterium]